MPLPESGMWDFALEKVLGDIEDSFLSGMASPLGPGIVAEDSALFAFLIHLVASNADVIAQYSGEMYHLASVMMLPLGVHNGNIHRYLPYLLQALERCGLADTDMLLMAFATCLRLDKPFTAESTASDSLLTRSMVVANTSTAILFLKRLQKPVRKRNERLGLSKWPEPSQRPPGKTDRFSCSAHVFRCRSGPLSRKLLC